jgi:outer membrane protein TolC
VQAQSLDSLKTLLREHNPELVALSYDYRAALAVSPQLTQLPDIQVGTMFGIRHVETRLGPQMLGVGVTQMLPWPGKLAALAAVADARARPILEEAAARQLELIYLLESTYYQLVEAEAKIEVIREFEELYRSLRQLALSRVASGRGSTVNVYRAELRLTALDRQVAALRANQSAGWAAIEELVNQALPRELVVPPAPPPVVLPADPPFDDHPLVRIFRLREDISRQELAVVDLDARPELGVGLDYVMIGRRDDAEPVGNGRDAVMARAMVRLPLGSRKFSARRQEESLRIQALGARREAATARLSAALEQADIRRRDALAQLDFLNEQTATLTAALEIARTEYANPGSDRDRGFDELIDLQEQLIDYRLRAAEANRIRYTQIAAIDRYLPRR